MTDSSEAKDGAGVDPAQASAQTVPSLRDYFIAHAPAEPQEWFSPVMPTERPSIPTTPKTADLPEGERKRRDYVAEFCDHMKLAELADYPVLRAFVEERQAAKKSMYAWDAAAMKARYVQWPAAWADEMLTARNPSGPTPDEQGTAS